MQINQIYPEDNVVDDADTAAESSRIDELNHRSYYESIVSQFEESQSVIEEIKAENAKLKLGYVPKVTYHKIDINDFIGHPCIYLIHLKETDYKFGQTGRMDQRYYEHILDFSKKGCKPKIVKIWKCATMQIMMNTENMIKTFGKQNKIKTKKYDHVEILKTDNIDHVVHTIDKYVDKQNSRDKTHIKLRLAEIELEREKISASSLPDKIRLAELSAILIPSQIRLAEIELENKRLDLEISRLKCDKPISVLPSVDEKKPNIFIEIKDSIESKSDDRDNSDENKVSNVNAINVTDIKINNTSNDKIPNKKQQLREQRIQSTRLWITNNHPKIKEATTSYYERYTIANVDPVSHNIFGPLVREITDRAIVQGRYHRHW